MGLGWGKDLGVEGEDNAIARNFSARLCSVGRGSFGVESTRNTLELIIARGKKE